MDVSVAALLDTNSTNIDTLRDKDQDIVRVVSMSTS